MNRETTLDYPDVDAWVKYPAPKMRDIPIHKPALGLLELDCEVVMATEIMALLPDSAGLYVGRMPFQGEVTVESLSALAEAIPGACELLPEAEWMDAIIYGCTSSTAILGHERVEELIHQRRPGVHVITPLRSVIAALHAVNARNLAVVTPYIDETNRALANQLTGAGFDIVSAQTLGQRTGAEMFCTRPEVFLDAALQADCDKADCLFISCTGIIVSPILQELEQRIGKPVVTSNQAIAWLACRRAGVVPNITGALAGAELSAGH